MSRHTTILALVAAALAAGAATTAAAEPARRTITICSDPWMPYAGDGTPGGDEGYVITLTREALARAGLDVRYVVVPWSRCIADVQAGRWDAIACVDAREVKDVVYPREPIGETAPTLFTLPGSVWRFKGLASLEQIRLGAIQHYAYADEIDGWVKDHAGDPRRLFLASGTEPLRRLLEMLDAGRVDAVIESTYVAAWTAHRLGRPPGSLRAAGTVGPQVPIYVAFSKRLADGPALARAFDEGLRALRAEGRIDAVLARYHLPPWRARPGPPGP